MTTYSITATTTETTHDIKPSSILDITVGAKDISLRYRKTPKAQAQAEQNDFITLKATKRYLIEARKGAFWAITLKAASETSICTINALNERISLIADT